MNHRVTKVGKDPRNHLVRPSTYHPPNRVPKRRIRPFRKHPQGQRNTKEKIWGFSGFLPACRNGWKGFLGLGSLSFRRRWCSPLPLPGTLRRGGWKSRDSVRSGDVGLEMSKAGVFRVRISQFCLRFPPTALTFWVFPLPGVLSSPIPSDVRV